MSGFIPAGVGHPNLIAQYAGDLKDDTEYTEGNTSFTEQCQIFGIFKALAGKLTVDCELRAEQAAETSTARMQLCDMQGNVIQTSDEQMVTGTTYTWKTCTFSAVVTLMAGYISVQIKYGGGLDEARIRNTRVCIAE